MPATLFIITLVKFLVMGVHRGASPFHFLTRRVSSYIRLNSLSHLHKRGLYGNLKDIHVSNFIGLPLLNLHTSLLLCGEDQGIDTHSHVVNNTLIRTHQESGSPKLAANKVIFNRSVGFMCEDTEYNTVLTCDTVDMCCPADYLHVVSQVLESG